MKKDKKGISGLIGYTGFVGQNIIANRSFDFLYNSKTINKIKNRHFDFLICAGAPGTKWRADKYPEKDLESINFLINYLSSVKSTKLILISTIAVYPIPINVNEDSNIDETKLSPYGYNRLQLEKFTQENFDVTILRLPALYGIGLKKNIIFDLINKIRLNKINTNSIYQFYNLSHLSDDIEKAIKHNIKLLNISPEPILLEHIIKNCFNIKIDCNLKIPARIENMLTKFGYIWGTNKDYLYLKTIIMKELTNYIKINQ